MVWNKVWDKVWNMDEDMENIWFILRFPLNLSTFPLKKNKILHAIGLYFGNFI